MATLFGLWFAACARVDDSTKGAGSSAQDAHAGASASDRAGRGGEPSIALVPAPSAGQPGFYPSPFDARTCPTPVSQGTTGSIRCLTRAELADSNWPQV